MLFIKNFEENPIIHQLVNKSINKMQYIHTIKRNEVLTHDITWINPENIMLNERSQLQKTTYCIIPFILSVPGKVNL